MLWRHRLLCRVTLNREESRSQASCLAPHSRTRRAGFTMSLSAARLSRRVPATRTFTASLPRCRQLTGNSHEEASITGTIPPHGRGVAVGQSAQVERTFRPDDVAAFGALVGDLNPLHQSWTRGSEPDVVRCNPLLQWHHNNVTAYRGEEEEEQDGDNSKVLVHGMLVASLFTRIFGTLIPGSIYLKQTLDFRKPVYAGEAVSGKVTVAAIRPWKRRGIVLNCDTVVTGIDGQERIRGNAHVWIVHGTPKEGP